MTHREKVNLVIGTMLIHNPTSTPFRIVGLNENKRNSGTIDKVTGQQNNAECWIFNLSDCSISNDMSLMY